MATVLKIAADERLAWFLERVPLIWLLLTVVTIAAVLHSIYKSGGFN
jgi:hypothetical protein